MRIKKLHWLMRHPRFRAKPIGTLTKVLFWEYVRLRRSTVSISFDHDLEVICRWNDGVCRLLYYFGTYFDETIIVLDKIISDGMTFVDVGANIGTHSLLAAKRVGYAGSVISFEPDPSVFEILRINMKDFPNSHIYNLAVSSSEMDVPLYVNSNTAKSSLAKHKYTVETIRVKATKLDRKIKGKIDILKLDVEGHELNVIAGSERLLRENAIKCILFECSGDRLDIISILKQYGYHIYGISALGDLTKEIFEPKDMTFNCLAVNDTELAFDMIRGISKTPCPI